MLMVTLLISDPTDDPHGADGGQDDPLRPPVYQVGQLLQASTNQSPAFKAYLSQSKAGITCSVVRLVAGLTVTAACSLREQNVSDFM